MNLIIRYMTEEELEWFRVWVASGNSSSQWLLNFNINHVPYGYYKEKCK